MNSARKKRAGKRRGIVWSLALVAAVSAAVFAAPWIISHTGLRHWALRAVVDDPALQVHADRLRLSWFGPSEAEGVVVVRDDESLRLDVERVAVDRSFAGLLFGGSDLGQVELVRPRLWLNLAQHAEPSVPSLVKTPGEKLFAACIRDGAIRLYSRVDEQAVVDLDGINLTLRVARGDEGRVLTIDPLRLVDHRPLTPELCDRGLQLVAPILAEAVWTEGEVSLDLKRFELPLDEPDSTRRLHQLQLEGVLLVHRARSGLKPTLLKDLSGALAALLDVPLPNTIQVVDNSRVQFRAERGRIHHEGMAFLIPEFSSDVVARSEGSVGFDETLDLRLHLPLPLDLLHEGPVLRAVSHQPVVLHITGTLDQPRVEWMDSEGWLADLAQQLLGSNGDPSQPGIITQLLQQLLDARQRDAAGPRSFPLLERWRQRRQSRDLRQR